MKGLDHWVRSSHVVVVGDVMLDRYTHGVVDRVSPEAPVPVLVRTSELVVPGGAGNAAANVAALGGTASLIGAIGRDGDGADLCAALCAANVDVEGLVGTARATSVKHRIVAAGQQIVRIDTEPEIDLTIDEVDRLTAAFVGSLSLAQTVILSDYGKGVCTRDLCKRVIEESCRIGVPVVVDPKSADFERYAGAMVVTPNIREARQAARDQTVPLDDIGQELASVTGASIVITRGAEGMSLYSPDASVHHLSAKARHVYDVTGAGDTVVAVIAICIGQGLEIREACQIANEAAAIVVSRRGTATVSEAELFSAIEQFVR